MIEAQMTRPDYCPVAGAPCQSMCDKPCKWLQAPEGYVLVPMKPTSDMLYAMAQCDGYQRGDRDHPMLTRWEDYWYMALGALPTAPEMSPVNVTRNICPTCESLARAVMMGQYGTS